ncbi:MAG TPA: 3'-5' exonuclease [Gemmatimonadaceae bacterium]|jgi:DNA polymerase-3 subunit epsilon|nr:3'-5' exonuclease [Gemmatimonadaceae bacterium]
MPLQGSPGVRLRPAEQALIARARDFLAAGPSDPVDLIAHVCQLPSPPRFVADHMAMALLAPWDEFAREGDGRWRLAADTEPFADSSARSAEALAGHPSLAAASDLSRSATSRREDRLADLSYVVVDVETTGGRAYAGDRITEIAAIVVQGGEITREFETLVNPQRPIPPMVTAITNITWNMVRNAPTFRDIADDVASVLRGHVFVAHNAAFDWRFVSSEITRATGGRLDGRRLCTVKLARKVLPQLPRRSLDHLARFYGVEIASRHRAGGDARATARVLIRLLREVQGRGCHTWAELEGLMSAVPRGRRRRRSAMPLPMDRDTTA